MQDYHGLQVRDGVREQVRDQVSRAKIQNAKFLSNTSAKQSSWDKVQVIGTTNGAINKLLMAGTRTSVAPSLTRSARQNTRRSARPNMKRSTSRLVSWISKPRCQYSNVLYTSKWNLSTGCISIVLTRIGSLFLAFENNHKYHCDCNETRWWPSVTPPLPRCALPNMTPSVRLSRMKSVRSGRP